MFIIAYVHLVLFGLPSILAAFWSLRLYKATAKAIHLKRQGKKTKHSTLLHRFPLATVSFSFGVYFFFFYHALKSFFHFIFRTSSYLLPLRIKCKQNQKVSHPPYFHDYKSCSFSTSTCFLSHNKYTCWCCDSDVQWLVSLIHSTNIYRVSSRYQAQF